MTSRTVLVTGATGLLGREVAKTFRYKGWTVKGTGFSRADGVDVLKVDLGDKEQVAKTLDDIKFAPPCFSWHAILADLVNVGRKSLSTVSHTP